MAAVLGRVARAVEASVQLVATYVSLFFRAEQVDRAFVHFSSHERSQALGALFRIRDAASGRRSLVDAAFLPSHSLPSHFFPTDQLLPVLEFSPLPRPEIFLEIFNQTDKFRSTGSFRIFQGSLKQRKREKDW